MGKETKEKKTSNLIEPRSKPNSNFGFDSASRGYGTPVQENSKRVVREFSSGGVVWKKEGSNLLWLVAKSNPSKDYPQDVWRLPKGWIDDKNDGKEPGIISSGEAKATEIELQQAAVREVMEEGGVEAKIIRKIGNELYVINSKTRKCRVLKIVTFYLMEWVVDLPAGFGPETAETEWLAYDMARKRLSYSGEKKILDKAKELLDSDTQPTLV